MSKGRRQETGDRRQDTGDRRQDTGDRRNGEWGMGNEREGRKKNYSFIFLPRVNLKSSLFELPRRKTLCFFKT
ncbi:MAG: hypothetical protein AB4080_05355 [Trichodesmium sp.]